MLAPMTGPWNGLSWSKVRGPRPFFFRSRTTSFYKDVDLNRSFLESLNIGGMTSGENLYTIVLSQ